MQCLSLTYMKFFFLFLTKKCNFYESFPYPLHIDLAYSWKVLYNTPSASYTIVLQLLIITNNDKYVLRCILLETYY